MLDGRMLWIWFEVGQFGFAHCMGWRLDGFFGKSPLFLVHSSMYSFPAQAGNSLFVWLTDALESSLLLWGQCGTFFFVHLCAFFVNLVVRVFTDASEEIPCFLFLVILEKNTKRNNVKHWAFFGCFLYFSKSYSLWVYIKFIYFVTELN